ncbi:uncharacterized protein LOC144887760 [Branchiostoma floridae x Branchiostoma japonicum]
MAPSVSKLASIFLSGQMTGLLKQIDKNVRRIVDSLWGLGGEVRQNVGGLLQKYLTLLTETIRECMYLKNFIEISKTKLEGVKDILTVVLDGTVSEILEDLHLQRYLPNFERKDLCSAYQLMKDTFNVEQVDIPTTMTAAAKEKLEDKIQEFRHGLDTIKDRIHGVKVVGERCYTSCKAITEKFGTFLQEINETQEAILSLLATHPNKTFGICVAVAIVAVGTSIALLATGIGSAAAACCAAFTILGVVIPVELPAGISAACGLLSIATGIAAWRSDQKAKHKAISEMEMIGTTLKELQEQLASMQFDAGKQKADWEKIETQAEKIVHYINNSQMEETAQSLHPSHHRPVRKLLHGVQVVLEDTAMLQASVVQFETEAEKVQQNLRDMSLMKSDAVLATPTETACEPPLQPLYDNIKGIKKEFQMCACQ